jgi:hypothetical protein
VRSIEARQNEAIKIVEDKPLWRFSLQHIELVAERHILRLECNAGSEEPGEDAPDQFEQNPHKAKHRPIRNFMPAG